MLESQLQHGKGEHALQSDACIVLLLHWNPKLVVAKGVGVFRGAVKRWNVGVKKIFSGIESSFGGPQGSQQFFGGACREGD